MPTIKDYKVVLASDSAVVFLLLGIAIMILGIVIHVPLMWPIGFVLAYTGRDVLGYKWETHHNYGIDNLLSHVPEDIRDDYIKNNFGPAQAAYRLDQHPTTALICAMAIPLVGILPVATFLILWITGLCDLLYYWYIEYPLPTKWSWLKWVLPFGGLLALFKADLPNWLLLVNVFLGITIAIIIQFL